MSFCDGPIRSQPHLLHNFPNLQTIKIVQAAGAIQRYGNKICMYRMLRHFGHIAMQNKLSYLQELHIQTACRPMMSLASLTSLKKLPVLTGAGGAQAEENLYIMGRIMNLPRGITQLRFRHCRFDSDPSAGPADFWSSTPLSLLFTLEASKHLRALQHLDLSYLAVDLRGNSANMSISCKARLPKCLSKLFRPNALTATPHCLFRPLTNLQSLHLGHPSFVSLPHLPSPLTELDLSGSKVADLTSLPTLFNLQKLTLPAAPSPAGLQCLKQTVRLKHVGIVEREGSSAQGHRNSILPWKAVS
ncbi:TPA: hypothetical protein ACH3X1_000577 [Trebouxia sp. C0004]